MKKIYEKPVFETIEIENKDIITASGGTVEAGYTYADYKVWVSNTGWDNKPFDQGTWASKGGADINWNERSTGVFYWFGWLITALA